MSQESKVVSLHGDADSRIPSTAEARKLGDACRKLTLSHLKLLIQRMFDTADDTLFKLAEKTGSNDEQGLYFDSMRIVRFKRDEIEEEFFNHISDAFRDFWVRTPHEEEPSLADISELSLIDEVDLEEDLAIKGLVRKIRSHHQQEISAIEKRLAKIVHLDVVADGNPMGPETLCQAFRKAIQVLNADIKIKLILYKLFDFHITGNIGQLYLEVNKQFIEAGVLPTLKLTIHNKATTLSASLQGEDEALNPTRDTDSSNMPQDNFFSTFQQLRHHPNVFSPGYPSPSSGAGPGTFQSRGFGAGAGAGAGNMNLDAPMSLGTSGGGFSVVSADAIVTHLTELQGNALSAAGSDTTDDHGEVTGEMIKQVITQGQPDKMMNPVDSDVIDLVSMLFEFVLEDEHLPAEAKAAIARLQIPIIKAAILDKEFFNITGHPARKLLNEMAHVALSAPHDSHSGASPILAAIEQAVQRILEEFKDEMEIFAEVLQDFQRTVEEELERSLDASSASLMPFRKKEQHALAAHWVHETIQEQIAGKQLPEALLTLLLGPWHAVMLDTYLDEGDESKRWKSQQRFIDILCWSIEPKFISRDRKKMGNIMRFLITTLREGLAQVDIDPENTERIILALEPFHLASLHGKSVDPEEMDEMDEDSSANMENSFAKLDEAVQALPEIETLNSDTEPCDYKTIMENIVLESWQPDESIEQGYPDDEYLHLARHLEAGKWIEFSDKDNNKTRAKLAWKSDLLGEYTFLNWKFDVVADKKLQELAADFRCGSARIIDDVPFIDRAFSTIMNTLQGRSAVS